MNVSLPREAGFVNQSRILSIFFFLPFFLPGELLLFGTVLLGRSMDDFKATGILWLQASQL